MAGNSFGQQFIVTTSGESHGLAMVAIVDGCPPGLELSEKDIQPELDRRRPGQSRYTTQRNEADKIRILSGVFEGVTTGAPISLIIENMNARTRDYESIKNVFRPGHADYTYHHKYGCRDYRGGGRASARETVLRVAAGAIAKKYLAQHFNTKVRACVTQIGKIKAAHVNWNVVDKNNFYFAELESIAALEDYISELRSQKDSIGARLLVEALNVPVGLGEPVFDRLDADIAKALMSISAAKAIAIGDGFDVVNQKGSDNRDAIFTNGFASNHAGGVLGGISTGQVISANVAFKAASSIAQSVNTIDTAGNSVSLEVKGRHDPCVGIRAVPIVESMVALVLMDHVLRVRGQCGLCEEKKYERVI